MITKTSDNSLSYYSVEQTNTTVESLQPFAFYSVMVSAETAVGSGPFSTAQLIQMPEDGKH